MPGNFPAGKFLRKADKCFSVCIVNWSMVHSVNCFFTYISQDFRSVHIYKKRKDHFIIAVFFREVDFRLVGRGKFAPVQKLARSESSLQQADHCHRSKKVRMPPMDLSYTVKKVSDIPVPSQDVTYQTLPGREYSFYYRPGRVWLVTSLLGTGMSLTFFLQRRRFFRHFELSPIRLHTVNKVMSVKLSYQRLVHKRFIL
jgi:hypothetical protein